MAWTVSILAMDAIYLTLLMVGMVRMVGIVAMVGMVGMVSIVVIAGNLYFVNIFYMLLI